MYILDAGITIGSIFKLTAKNSQMQRKNQDAHKMVGLKVLLPPYPDTQQLQGLLVRVPQCR